MADRAEEMKREVARAALAFVRPGEVLGVGTGSTANHFIDLLRAHRHDIPAAVASSDATAERLRAVGIEVVSLNDVGRLSVYVDGADEINPQLAMIKGGGAALTREKIVAEMAETVVCIADERKWVPQLGAFPLPIEVIPMARSLIARAIVKLGGNPVYRTGVVTDNGHVILDVYDLDLSDPVAMESTLNQWPGVVTCGLFARRPADVLLLARPDGVERIDRPTVFSRSLP